MIKSIITIILLSFSCAVFAQNIEFKAANFKDDKDGLKAATDAIKKGDEGFAKKDWANAKSAYTEALALKGTEVYPKNQIAAIDIVR